MKKSYSSINPEPEFPPQDQKELPRSALDLRLQKAVEAGLNPHLQARYENIKVEMVGGPKDGIIVELRKRSGPTPVVKFEYDGDVSGKVTYIYVYKDYSNPSKPRKYPTYFYAGARYE